MGSLDLCTSLLLLCLARSSLQGGVKPQGNARGALYLPTLIRGAAGVPTGAGLGPVGAKAGKYPGYGAQRLPTGLGYGVPAGYGAGLGTYPQAGKQKPGYRGVGYPRGGLPLGAYPGGGYPSNGLQNGYSNGYGAGGNGFPGAGLQPGGYGNGNGAQTSYGPAGDPSAAKYGGAGQLSYNGQPEAAGLGGDYGAGRYGNGNGLGYMNGGDPQANGLEAGIYGPLAAGGYGRPMVPGQALGGYGGKESKYSMNGFLGNGYRGRCPAGKC
ncbi:glycine rich extracellular protein 1 isoform X5 [Hemicordylus capensis]|uniref:glycine rich extracellular protein 1 isoform X5 n=1 Tax=Hemicordylus capensis TaxID=884348 RepID=UPI002302D411|nr:glycine rich extracellular protein 1 isoform X5 [Hemicordylus capensis]